MLVVGAEDDLVVGLMAGGEDRRVRLPGFQAEGADEGVAEPEERCGPAGEGEAPLRGLGWGQGGGDRVAVEEVSGLVEGPEAGGAGQRVGADGHEAACAEEAWLKMRRSVAGRVLAFAFPRTSLDQEPVLEHQLLEIGSKMQPNVLCGGWRAFRHPRNHRCLGDTVGYCCGMYDSSKYNWVWYSTEESRAAGQVSVLAVAETVLCVAVYWVLVLWLGLTWHHWMILIAAPMVLLRSEGSVATGVAWFEWYVFREKDVKSTSFIGIFSVILSATLAFWGSSFLAMSLLQDSSGWDLFWKGMLIGWLALNVGMMVAFLVEGTKPGGFSFALVVAALAAAATAAAAATGATAGLGAIAGAVAVAAGIVLAAALGGAMAGTAAAAVFFPGVFICVWLSAVGVRLTATLRFLWPGLLRMAQNWRFAAGVSDLCHPPELVPGHTETAFPGFSVLFFGKPDGEDRDVADVAINLLALLFFHAPALLWRWSIKSTAWFYLPLLWVRRGWLRHEGEELRVWAQSYSRKAINRLWLIFGGLSFVALVVGLFSLEKWLTLQKTVADAGAPMTFLGILMSLNWAEVMKQPWMWFYLASYGLTICIFFALDGIAAEIRDNAPLEPRMAQMARWQWAANARAVLTNIGLALALWFFLSAVGAWEQIRDLVMRIF